MQKCHVEKGKTEKNTYEKGEIPKNYLFVHLQITLIFFIALLFVGLSSFVLVLKDFKIVFESFSKFEGVLNRV